MTTNINPHTLTKDQYNAALYQLLLMLEESGTAKTEAYTDGRENRGQTTVSNTQLCLD